MERLDKPCEMCGETMYDVTNRRMYCDKCSKLKAREYRERCITKKKAKKPEKRKSTIDEIARLAREKGISYGKYVALYRSGV